MYETKDQHMAWLWVSMILLRWVFVVWPQPGYIHPDEFFQSVEVVSGILDIEDLLITHSVFIGHTLDIEHLLITTPSILSINGFLSVGSHDNQSFYYSGFSILPGQVCEATSTGYLGDVLNIEVHKTWEFTREKPLRNTLLPSLLYWPAYLVLKICTASGIVGHNGYVTTTALLVAPRIVIALIGLCVDILVYKTMKLYRNYDAHAGMWMYATSYISLVFYTRTFSNTLEAFLFVGLTYLIQADVQRLAKYNKLHPRSKLTQSSRTVDTRTVEAPCAKQTCLLGVVMVAGVFNRPTFLMYLYFPYLYWLCDGNLPQTISEFFRTTQSLIVKLHQTLLRACVPFMVFILWDSVYYGSIIHLKDFTSNNWKSNLFDSFTVTPLNFASYNAFSENLADHGTHSRFTHFFVNIPMLFGPMSICVIYDVLTLVLTRGSVGLRRTSTLDQTDTKFWIYTLFIPVTLLSLFPHQEPRFLIPLLLPVCVLYSHLVCGKRSRNLFKILWLLLNIAGFLFFGFLHQGGIVKAIDDIRLRVIHTTESQTQHVIFSHTYMPPKHLFSIQSQQTCTAPRLPFIEEENLTHLMDYLKCGEQPNFIENSKLKLYDLQGRPLEYVEEKVKTIRKFGASADELVYLIAPSSLEVALCMNTSRNYYQYIYEASYGGHVTMEDPPSGVLWELLSHRGFPQSLCSHENTSPREKHKLLDSLLSLNLYRVAEKKTLQAASADGES